MSWQMEDFCPSAIQILRSVTLKKKSLKKKKVKQPHRLGPATREWTLRGLTAAGAHGSAEIRAQAQNRGAEGFAPHPGPFSSGGGDPERTQPPR